MMTRHRVKMVAIPKALIEDESLTCYQRIVYLRIAALEDGIEEIPSDIFAKDLCCTKDEIEQTIKSLVDVGWLYESDGAIGTNVVKGGYNEEDEYIL